MSILEIAYTVDASKSESNLFDNSLLYAFICTLLILAGVYIYIISMIFIFCYTNVFSVWTNGYSYYEHFDEDEYFSRFFRKTMKK